MSGFPRRNADSATPAGTLVVLSPTAATEQQLRIAVANGDQAAAAELLRRQGAEAA